MGTRMCVHVCIHPRWQQGPKECIATYGSGPSVCIALHSGVYHTIEMVSNCTLQTAWPGLDLGPALTRYPHPLLDSPQQITADASSVGVRLGASLESGRLCVCSVWVCGLKWGNGAGFAVPGTD